MAWMRDRRVGYALGGAYVVALVVLVIGPWGWELNRFTVWLYVQFRSDMPVAPTDALPEHYGLLLNVLLFMPLGALLTFVTGRPWWWVALVACAGSVAVELVQWRWLERDGDWTDVAANTLGGLVGAVVVSPWSPGRPRRAGRSPRARRP